MTSYFCSSLLLLNILSFGSVMNSNVWDSEASAQAYWTIYMGSQSPLGLAAAMN
jgi:hypothetical protein